MGQAKARGTREQRVAAALEKKRLEEVRNAEIEEANRLARAERMKQYREEKEREAAVRREEWKKLHEDLSGEELEDKLDELEYEFQNPDLNFDGSVRRQKSSRSRMGVISSLMAASLINSPHLLNTMAELYGPVVDDTNKNVGTIGHIDHGKKQFNRGDYEH